MTEEQLFKKFAKYYDKIYADKDYEHEAKIIKWAVKKHKISKGKKLLDVACGTGSHAARLKNKFTITGLDINPEMLKLARRKVSRVKFIKGDMKTLALQDKFDVITCLFTSMTYNQNYEELENSLKNFFDHLKNGGVVIFDIGIHKDHWLGGSIWINTYSDKDLQLARISQSPPEPKDGIFEGKMIFLIKDKGKVDFEIDEHKLGVFEPEKIKIIMRNHKLKNMLS